MIWLHLEYQYRLQVSHVIETELWIIETNRNGFSENVFENGLCRTATKQPFLHVDLFSLAKVRKAKSVPRQVETQNDESSESNDGQTNTMYNLSNRVCNRVQPLFSTSETSSMAESLDNLGS